MMKIKSEIQRAREQKTQKSNEQWIYVERNRMENI